MSAGTGTSQDEDNMVGRPKVIASNLSKLARVFLDITMLLGAVLTCQVQHMYATLGAASLVRAVVFFYHPPR